MDTSSHASNNDDCWVGQHMGKGSFAWIGLTGSCREMITAAVAAHTPMSAQVSTSLNAPVKVTA